MAIQNTRAAFVNRSNTNITVYSDLVNSSAHTGGITVGGTVLGKIYPDECYTVIPNDSVYITSYEIVFRDSTGAEAHGYIETSYGSTLGDYEWVDYQEPYHYYNSNGSSLVSAKTENVDGKKQYIFTVMKEVAYLSPANAYLGKLEVGTKLATTCSTVGVGNPGHMLFNKKDTGNGWEDMYINGDYAFVSLGFNIGSKATNRAIY